MSEDFISGLHDDLVEAMERYERRSPHGRLAAGRYPRLPRPATLARIAAGAALIVALVAVVVTVWRESDVERPVAPPGKKLVATDVERGVRFSLDGRVLTVQLLPDKPNLIETVSGAEISATCRTNIAAPPGDPRSQSTVFRRWPAGETSLSYRFPRDVSGWCRLDRASGGLVAFVSFPGASPGARGCEPGLSIPACRAKARQWGEYFLGATAQRIAIRGDRAAATLSNDVIVQLRRSATGEWLIDGIGPIGAVGPDAAAERRQRGGP